MELRLLIAYVLIALMLAAAVFVATFVRRASVKKKNQGYRKNRK